VLVSTVTDYPLTLRTHHLIQKRTGALDQDELYHLASVKRLVAIVDATHPYAETIGSLGREIANKRRLPYFRFLRPSTLKQSEPMHLVSTHIEAACVAFSFGKKVLLTIGTKNLAPYVHTAESMDISFVARVLNRQASINACVSYGIQKSCIVAEHGPFTVDENIAHIRRFNIGVLVTKDSGCAGGVPEKIAAAEQTQCRVVVAARPQEPSCAIFRDVESLVAEVGLALGELHSVNGMQLEQILER
jgi:precorrin-6A/cobalt-precorrin-6A reductase